MTERTEQTTEPADPPPGEPWTWNEIALALATVALAVAAALLTTGGLPSWM